MIREESKVISRHGKEAREEDERQVTARNKRLGWTPSRFKTSAAEDWSGVADELEKYLNKLRNIKSNGQAMFLMNSLIEYLENERAGS